MSILKVREYLKKYELDDKIMEFDVSSATVKEAALALNSSEGEIAKTLSFMIDDKPILILTSGDAKIDNSKYKAEFHKKAKMISPGDVEKLIGHAPGGVCPFGINDGVDVFLDNSLKQYKIVYPACGSSNSAIKLTIEELENIVDYKKWIDVTK